MTRGKIGETEAIALLVTIITSKIYLTFPTVLVDYGGSAAWQIILLSGLVCLLLFGFIYKFMQVMGENNFPATVESLTGPYLGGLIVFLVLLPWLVDVAMTLRRFSEMMIIIALPETPISYVVLCFIGSSAVAAYLGIQTIARACYLSFPFSLGAIILIIVLTYPSWNKDWLFPLMGKGIDRILTYGVLRTSDFGELNFIYVVPLVFYARQVKRIGYKSIGISLVILLTVMITYLLTFPPVVAEEPYLPLYMMARSVYLGRFLQRIEAVFVLFWVISGFLWISAGIYGFVRLLSDYLKLPDYRPLILPSAVVITAIAFIPANLPDVVLFSVYQYRNYSFLWVFGLPAFLLLVARFRGKGALGSAKR